MGVGRLPLHRAGVATRQFAPLVASLTGGGAFPSTTAFARTADPRVATVAPQLGWDPCAPTHAFPSVFAHPFSPTFESRRVTTSDMIELLTQDQQQRYQNRSIQAVTHTNTITTVYKDGRPPSVHRTSSRSSTPRTPETPPTPVRF